MQRTQGENPRLFTFEMHQDDPSKCTSAKMRKLGFARQISKGSIAHESIVLNPIGAEPVSKQDRSSTLLGGLVVIDCSWAHAQEVFKMHFKGIQRRLPGLVAGNPTNYSKLGALSSVEAMAGALYIMNFKELAVGLLSIYKWGETFLTLNHDALEDYSKANSLDEMRRIELDYFPSAAGWHITRS